MKVDYSELAQVLALYEGKVIKDLIFYSDEDTQAVTVWCSKTDRRTHILWDVHEIDNMDG
jgi:hypothetical protein